MLSDNERIKNIRSKKSRLPSKKGWYSDSQKMEAVKCWLITGNLTQTAATLNIPLVTLKSWRYSEWWAELVADIRSEDSMKLSARLKKIAAKSLDLTEDRLENGDWVLNQKTGALIRKPVGVRDLNLVSTSAINHIDKLEGHTEERADTKKVTDQLVLLAQKFEEFAKAKRPVQVTDVIFVENDNAVYEEREEGLQGGEELGEDEGNRQS